MEEWSSLCRFRLLGGRNTVITQQDGNDRDADHFPADLLLSMHNARCTKPLQRNAGNQSNKRGQSRSE